MPIRVPIAGNQSRIEGIASVGPVIFDERLLEAVLSLTGPGVDSGDAAMSALAPGIGLGDFFVMSLKTRDWRSARQWLFRWLPVIRTLDVATLRDRTALIAEINRKIFSRPIRLQLTEVGLRVCVPETISATCALALLPFLLPGGWATNRLAECRFRKCGQWFLRPRSRRGTAPEYCSQAHAGNERVARLRDRARGRKRSSGS
jgi:hypothetical protein